MNVKRFPIWNAPADTVVPFPGPAAPRAPRPWYSMQNKGGGTGEIFIYDVIGDPWDGTTAKGFADALKGLGEVATLNVFINSPGGSVFDGVAIFNQLHRHKARVIVNIDGMALSIASVVAMAGNEIRMAANGMMMIHDPWTLVVGTAQDMRTMADTLDKVASSIRGTYVDRTGNDDAAIRDMMAAETWLDAQDALDRGFIDAIGDEVQIAAKASGFAAALAAFKHAPPDLVEAAAAAPVDYRDTVANLRKRAEARL